MEFLKFQSFALVANEKRNCSKEIFENSQKYSKFRSEYTTIRLLWNKRKDFLKALLTSANLNSWNKDSFLDQHVENTVTGIHLLKSIFRRDERANNTKIRLHSRRNGSSNWYERLNEPDNTDNAKICVMNTIDKGKASF